MQNTKKITKAEEVNIGDFVKLEDWDYFLEVTGLDQSRLPARIRITEEDYSSWYDISQGFIKQGDKEMDNFVMNVGINTHLQPGTKVRCVDNAECSSFLTTGKIYEVSALFNGGFSYLDDDGDTLTHYLDSREPVKFEIVQENNEMKNSNTTDETDTPTTPDEFQVGDEVWCIVSGKGKVTSVADKLVRVEYPGMLTVFYTSDGRLSKTSGRVLFFSEPKIEASVTRPFVPTLVGKRVVAQYHLGHFGPIRTVVNETPSSIYYDDHDSDIKSCLSKVYEVPSENLLRK